MKIKSILKKSICLLLVFLMLLRPMDVLAGSKSGLFLWFETVLPTLLPYIILSNLLLYENVIASVLMPFSRFFQILLGLSPSGSYALVVGLFCGYPLGAKITGDLYHFDSLSKEEAEYLLGFVNNPSPGFLLNYVLLEILQLKSWWVILCAYYLSLFLTIQLLHVIHRREMPFPSFESIKKEASNSPSIGKILDTSIMNGFETVTKLGGYILLCTILQNILIGLFKKLKISHLFLLASLEISSGLQLLSHLPISPTWQLTSLLSLTASGGLCILMQTYSVLNGYGLSIKPYLKGKCIHTAITLCTLLLISQIV